MTKAACESILAVSTICLVWRSIKALKRSTGTKQFDDKNQNDTGADGDIESDDSEIEIDWEILQLWALYAFHVLYVSSGVEWCVSFIPFYYYLKMIILIITVVPSTKFPNFWFEILLVPMMKRAHEVLDVDWIGYLYSEVVEIPHRVLSILIISDEEALAVRKLREEQLRDALGEDTTEITHEKLDDMPSMSGVRRSRSSKKRKDKLSSSSRAKGDSGSSRKPKSSIFTSPLARSRVAASSLHLQKFSKSHRCNLSKSETRTRSHQQTSEESLGVIEPKSTFAVLRKRAGQSQVDNTDRSNIVRRPPASAFNHNRGFASSGKKVPISPSKRKVRSKKIAPTSTVPTTPESPKKTLRDLVEENSDDDGSGSNVKQSSRYGTGRSSSIGLGVRKFITGDASIRVRDYLFDLNLPSLPSPTRINDSEKSKGRRRQSLDDNRRKMMEEWRKDRGNHNTKKGDGNGNGRISRRTASSSKKQPVDLEVEKKSKKTSRNRKDATQTQTLKSAKMAPKTRPKSETTNDNSRLNNGPVRRSRRLAAAAAAASSPH